MREAEQEESREVMEVGKKLGGRESGSENEQMQLRKEGGQQQQHNNNTFDLTNLGGARRLTAYEIYIVLLKYLKHIVA